ncbi:MAG: hypothetical protein AB7O50_11805 [Pseudolabrys sp.]
MVDALTGLIGGALMTTFVLLIAVKLNLFPLWIVILIGLALMAWAIWTDGLAPLFRRNGAQQ